MDTPGRFRASCPYEPRTSFIIRQRGHSRNVRVGNSATPPAWSPCPGSSATELHYGEKAHVVRMTQDCQLALRDLSSALKRRR